MVDKNTNNEDKKLQKNLEENFARKIIKPPHNLSTEDDEDVEYEYVDEGDEEYEDDENVEYEYVDENGNPLPVFPQGLPPMGATPFPYPQPPIRGFIPHSGIPPQRMGMDFPPPHMRMMPPPPPLEWEEIIEYKEYHHNSDENSNSVYPEEKVFDPMGETSPTKKPDALKNDKAEKMLEMGIKQAEEMRTANFWSKIFFCLRILLTITILAILSFGCFQLINYYYEKISEKGRITEEILKKNDVLGNSFTNWTLGNSIAAKTIKEFYEASGNLSAIADTTDMLLKGTIQRGDRKEDFYCIQKGGKTFLKIGSDKDERSYMINSIGKSVKRYESKDSSLTYDLSEKEALLISGLCLYDSPLFERAFSKIGTLKSYNQDIVYEGQPIFDDKISPSVSLYEGTCKIQYYFDNNTHLISACVLTDKNAFPITIYYDKYSVVDGIKFPEIRTVYLSNKEVAKITIDFMVRNRGIMFPH